MEPSSPKKPSEKDKPSGTKRKRKASSSEKKSASSFKRPKITLPAYSKLMREAVLKGKDLSDRHIDLAQQLLKLQFPWIGGLQSCLLHQHDLFKSETEGALQLHHDGASHWVASSSLDGEVTLYDSKYHGNLTPSLSNQLARIYKELIKSDDDGDQTDLCINIAPIQQQKGSTDCGIFAIAFALHIALNDIPEQMFFYQAEMRPHLHRCFMNKELEPFPHKKLDVIPRQPHGHLPFLQLLVYCSCLMPDTYDDMISCDNCEAWYHVGCVGFKV